MADQKGTVGLVHAIATGMTVKIGGQTFTVVASYDYAKEARNLDTRGNIGDVINRTYYNRMETLSVEVLPAGANMTAVKSQLVVCPKPGDEVEVANTEDTQIAGTVAGNTKWIVQSATKRTSPEGMARFACSLKRYATDLDDIAAS